MTSYGLLLTPYPDRFLAFKRPGNGVVLFFFFSCVVLGPYIEGSISVTTG